jgi:hypothetical protein
MIALYKAVSLIFVLNRIGCQDWRSKRSLELDDSNEDSFSSYMSMESDFYSRNANKTNDILVFVSNELTPANTTHKFESQLTQSVILSMSEFLRENFLCSLKQNLILSNECKKRAGNASNRFSRSVRVVGRRISPSIEFTQIKKLHNQIEEGYFKEFNLKREDKTLYCIFIIAKTNLISMFKLLFRNLNVPIIALDVHSFLYRLNPNLAKPGVSVSLVSYLFSKFYLKSNI